MSADEAEREAWQWVMQNEPPETDDPYLEFTRGVFAGVWRRPGLGRRDRRLTSLTAIAVGGYSEILPHHLRPALESGDLTPDELMEWVCHLAHYGGWPASAQAYTALRTVVAELGLEFSTTEHS